MYSFVPQDIRIQLNLITLYTRVFTWHPYILRDVWVVYLSCKACTEHYKHQQTNTELNLKPFTYSIVTRPGYPGYVSPRHAYETTR